MKSPPRLYNAASIAQGVHAVSQLQQHVLSVAPTSIGPLAALDTQTSPLASLPEIMEGYCPGCRAKKSFPVDGSEPMPNGAIRKYGKADCGHTISAFTSGVHQDAGA